MLLFHGIKVPDEFDNSNWTIFIAEEIKPALLVAI
jgi:hypothetical protein